MDGRGRIAQPLNWNSNLRTRNDTANSVSRLGRLMDRWSWLLRTRLPRGAGTVAFALLVAASVAYGIVKGEHVPELTDALKSARDGLGNQVGFRIKSIAISGSTHMSREQVLAVAGITGSTSLLFLDVEDTRERLKTSPWVADASVLKLYPGELQIGIKEREAFALWQKDGQVSVIAQDGTVLDAFVAPGMTRLPLVVGAGAQTQAKAFLSLLDRHSALREQVRASVMVGERRWNLRLKNGLDVQLPETGVAAALDRLVELDRQKNLIARDIVTIDLRLADRVTVRLSDAAAEARASALKEKKAAKKGRDT
jgi:cell division protein FtsQ